MKKISASILVLVSTFAAPAFAEEAAAPTPEHTLTGNVTLASSYRFRGIDQTFGKPALQGGFDYSHSNGVYLGNWNSNISSGAGYPGGNLEMDFYGGWKGAFGDFGVDVGALYYYYPGTSSDVFPSRSNFRDTGATVSGNVDNLELYVAGSWKFLTLKYSYSINEYFKLPKSEGTSYLELNGAYDLGDGWGVNGHVGHLFSKDYEYNTTGTGSRDIDYTDWKLGVTKDISGWVIGLAYVGTDAKGDCNGGEFYCLASSINRDGTFDTSKFKNGGRSTAVLSVSKSF